MVTRVSDLLLAMTVRAQQNVNDWVDSAQSQVATGNTVYGDITIKCDWVNKAKSLENKAGDVIGNIWGLAATYGGYFVIVLAILIALFGRFAFGKRLTGMFLWILIGLFAVGAIVQIVQSSVGSPCS